MTGKGQLYLIYFIIELALILFDDECKKCLRQVFVFRRGSIITCQVQKHGTEIFEVKVWLHFITISKSDSAKIKTEMYKMDINVQYVERTTSLGVF